MKRRIIRHIIYWLLILLLLTLFFGHSWESYTLAFYFASLLLPIVIGTSYFFNLYLVPKYFLPGKYWQFALHFFYMLVVSLYFEMLVTLLSFIVLAKYRVDVIDLKSISIFILGITLYLIVFATSFIRIALQFREKLQQVHSLRTEIEKKQKATIQIRANRKNYQVAINEILYIESLSDYVKLVTVKKEFTTREKITNIDNRLPNQFIRVHRSFVINKEKVQSYSRNQVSIQGHSIPIGRTYKKSALKELQNQKKESE